MASHLGSWVSQLRSVDEQTKAKARATATSPERVGDERFSGAESGGRYIQVTYSADC